jgi:ketosteroid isomerase-like protein
MTSDHDAIRRHFESFAAALHAKDVERVMAHYAPNALAFDLAPPLQHRRDEIERGLRDWFTTWTTPIASETRDLTITADGEVAFAHSLNHMKGQRTDGTTTDVWFRATVCLRKLAGGWKIAHEHTSVPFYMDGSFRAAVDLHP